MDLKDIAELYEDLNVEEKVIEMLDEYFKNNKDSSFKKEVALFVSSYLEDIKELAERVVCK